MGKPFVFSLRAYLALLLGLLVAVALAFAAGDLRQHWSLYRKTSALVERNHAADRCLQAVANFAYERGRVNVVLRGAAPISEDNRRFIDGRRQLADGHIADALATRPASAQVKADAVEKAWETVKATRLLVDGEMSLPIERRDRQLAGRWMQESDRLIDQLESFLVSVSTGFEDVDAVFDRLASLRVQALRFRILVGKETTMVAAGVSASHLPDRQMLNSAYDLHGQIAQLWSSLESGIEGLGDAGVFQFGAWAQSRVFWVLRPLQEDFFHAVESGRKPSVTIGPYLKASIEALDSTVGLADAINRRAEAYTKQMLDQARWRIGVSLGLIVVVLAMSGFVVWVMVTRFTRPLNDVIRRIDKLLREQSGAATGKPPATGRDELGKVQGALELLDEAIAARMQSEAALRKSERVNASILACAPQAIIGTDIHGMITVFSPGAEKMLGYSAVELVGTRTPLAFHDPKELEASAAALSRETGVEVGPDFGLFPARMRLKGDPDESEWTYIRKDGTRLTVMLALTFLRDESGEINGCLGVATDITERTVAAAKISRMAYYDHLTQLPNSLLLKDRLQMAMLQARRDGTRLALLLIDLDRFKPVNDSFGHAVGDLLLKAVAERMQSCLRESDTLARIGGDEFVALLSGIHAADDALSVAEKLRQRLGESFELESGHVVSIACSVGVAIFPDDGEDEIRLQKCADDAMYASKEAGRDCVTLFGRMQERIPAMVSGGAASVLRLVWHKSFQSGDPDIDREHRKLFNHVNALLRAMMQGGEDGQHLLLSLDRLIRDTRIHFLHEEKILGACGFAGLEKHVRHHRHLLEHVKELRKRAAVGELAISDLVVFMAQDVIYKHLLTEDVVYFEALRLAKQLRRGEKDEREST